MTPTPHASNFGKWSRWGAIVAAYLVLVAGILRQVLEAPNTRTVGIPSIDSLDTAMLRGLVANAVTQGTSTTDFIYYPVGYPVWQLTPNVLDHLTALPFVLSLPFPLADNLWWWLMLSANGIAAHWMGLRVGGNHTTGLLAGVGFVTADAVLREANLHHAPQVMLAWAPILLALLLTPSNERTTRTALAAGFALSMGALAYWYSGLFAALAFLPLLLRQTPRHLVLGASATLLLCGPFLLPQLWGWDERPLTSGATLAPPRGVSASYATLPESEQFIAWHGTDPLFWIRDVTSDTSNRVPISLIIAAIVGAIRWDRATRFALAFVVIVGAVMVLGPVLRWGDDIALVGGHPLALPFRGFRALHPFFERLTWPERWGWLIPLGLVALALRAPKPHWFALAFLAENAVLSNNFTVAHGDLRHEVCWRSLHSTTGAVVELPLDRGLKAARAAVHGRMHGHPVVNPVLLPPGARPPDDWADWAAASPLMTYLSRIERGQPTEAPTEAERQAWVESGITVIALDVEPGAGARPAVERRIRTALTQHLGDPIDLGCANIWWLDPIATPPIGLEQGTDWRDEAAAWKKANPAPELDVLIQPMWDELRTTRKGNRP